MNFRERLFLQIRNAAILQLNPKLCQKSLRIGSPSGTLQMETREDICAPSDGPMASLVVAVCPPALLTITVDPSFTTVAVMLAPLNAVSYGLWFASGLLESGASVSERTYLRLITTAVRSSCCFVPPENAFTAR
jgi:hypothetical protein